MSRINRVFEKEDGEQWEIIEILEQDDVLGTIYLIRRVYDAKESHVLDSVLDKWEFCGRITWI